MGQDPGVGCRANAARTLWLLGYPDQALVHLHDALTLAHELSPPGCLAPATAGTAAGGGRSLVAAALDVARRQESKALELRAAMSLSRLWQQQGKQAEARALLAPVYIWFTEGLDTADLQEARALLDEPGVPARRALATSNLPAPGAVL